MTHAVWDKFDGSGRSLLKFVLVCMADYADDTGGRVYPSIATIAGRTGCSPKQARRKVHELVKLGVVTVVRDGGGAPTKSRQYQLNIDRLTTPLGGRGTTPLGGSQVVKDPPIEARHQPPPTNPAAEIIFSLGVQILKKSGRSESSARSFLGKLVKDHGEVAVAELIGQLAARPVIEPCAYLKKALEPKQRGLVV